VSEFYIENLASGIQKIWGCSAKHLRTVPVRAMFNDKIAWDGEVEVFELAGHPKAKLCYSWGLSDNDGKLDATNVLEIPPVNSPETAVMIAIANAARVRAED